MSCADSSDRTERSVRDLALREPDLRLEEARVLRPDPKRQWGAASPRGWIRKTHRLENGTPYALSNATTPGIDLVATGPAERTIELEAWLPLSNRERERSQRVPVRLNGSVVGEVFLTHLPSRVRVTPPAESWQVGRNRLELDLGQDSRRGTPLGTCSLAVSEIRYGHGGALAGSPGGWTLEPDTGLRYWIEPLSARQLRISGEAEAPGRLEVQLARFDPAQTDEHREKLDQVIPVGQGDVEVSVPLPSASDEVMRLDVLWRSPSASAVRIDGIEILGSPRHEQPSIILISIDTLSAHHTSLYGYPRKTTPNLERLAAEAFVFRRCAANAPWTAPSYAALFTGLYPATASMKIAEESNRYDLPSERWSLPESLRSSGYRTGAFVDVIWLEERFGFSEGFEHFDESASAIPHPEASGGIQHIQPRALAWLDSLGAAEPFFLFLHAYDVHGPYLPAEPWAGRFAGDGLEKGCDLFVGNRATYRTITRSQLFHTDPGEAFPEKVQGGPLVTAYDEEILALDAGLGELFDALSARGILDRSWVVFTADHGEATCDHDYFGHGLLYEETIQVPLVIRPPGGTAAKEPTWIDTSAQLVDLYPTLLELAGIPAKRPYLHGRSLVPAFRGGRLPARPTFSEGGVLRQAAVELGGWKLIEMHPGKDSLPWTMLSSPHLPRTWLEQNAPQLVGELPSKEVFKLLFANHKEAQGFFAKLSEALPPSVVELYDLGNDPFETTDLSSERPDKVAELLPLLRECQTLREMNPATGGAAPLTEDDLKRLEALGYADSDEE